MSALAKLTEPARRGPLLCAVLSLLTMVAACDGREQPVPPPAPSVAPETELVVFAAASLREAFLALGKEFENAHSGVKVTFNFAGTQELRTQVEQGATPDVFAAADQKHIAALMEANLVAVPQIFARNEPVLVLSKETVGKVQTLADLPNLTRIVLGSPAVPIGRYSLQILRKASESLGADFVSRVEAKVVSRELSVRQVLAKVRLGEAEAGIVYRTDTTIGAQDIGVVDIPEAMNAVAEYPIAIAVTPAHPTLASDWLGLVLSDVGRLVLRQAGFLGPEGRAP